MFRNFQHFQKFSKYLSNSAKISCQIWDIQIPAEYLAIFPAEYLTRYPATFPAKYPFIFPARYQEIFLIFRNFPHFQKISKCSTFFSQIWDIQISAGYPATFLTGYVAAFPVGYIAGYQATFPAFYAML